ncbi:hypothetical protein GWI33_023375 [Rhynchophorus ferrugineus]|uniref:Beta-galactosidase n=1 Tax=Rhynchophorus ferrugineus TaxID=354439 RepID=A0A834ITI5_RHYFE|nr:hypothetical protein GWI33_023375 [Rhynchophorus ferrugineus]
MAYSVGVPLVNSLPTNYQYYTDGGIKEGLNANQSFFTLNDKLIRIYSGAMHYFRVPRKYWRDRLKKIRAAGLNSVETYVPWNLHEPEPGKYDFGNGGSEMEDFLHLEEFINTAKEEDLFVILRTGPYICSEYNFGGFPSWLLREKTMGFRISEQTYMNFVSRYFNVLLTLLAAFQFTRGGPVIAFQKSCVNSFLKNGIVELLVTSDSPLSSGSQGSLPGLFLQTANFGGDANGQLNKLAELQPDRPLMVMEFWIGWFDFWGANHTGKSDADTRIVLTDILAKNASFNIYMFHGGTNFGFTNGASLTNDLFDNSGYESITTSYDYDSPLSENGAYRNKYYIVKELVANANPIQTLTPEPPEIIPPVAYESVDIQKALPLKKLLDHNSPNAIESKYVTAMELLDINNNSGQGNGYIVYRKENMDLPEKSMLTIGGHVCDTVLVLVNGELLAPKQLKVVSDLERFGFWRVKDGQVQLNNAAIKGATIDIVVEEMGRMNGGNIFQYNQTFKGLWQDNVTLNSEVLSDFKIIPLEMKKKWINELSEWEDYTAEQPGTAFYSAILHVEDEPQDTFIDMREWGKGMVFVNGFALGRYAAIGPQQTLYLPAPFLETGDNTIVLFEHFYTPATGKIVFSAEQIFDYVH